MNKPYRRLRTDTAPSYGFRTIVPVLLSLACLTIPVAGFADAREQAKRIHDRLAGVPATDTVLDAMENEIANNSDAMAAANIAMDNRAFYNVTLKNWATPWTNEDFDVFQPLNDYTATVIGLVRDGADFRELLYGDVIYVGTTPPALYSDSNNTHYEQLEASGDNLGDPAILQRRTQSAVTGIDPAGVAGIFTTRAAARAFFLDGTNRAMFRFTLVNHLCTDLEQIKDFSAPTDRIRQDVSRSPGGDSRIFLNNCVGCHAGMDPLAQAFAYYEWDYKDADPMTEDDPDTGRLVYTAGVVQPKYHINDNTFQEGYRTPDDQWVNYWRVGPNSGRIGWDPSLPGAGAGAASMGRELAHSDAFAYCQVKKAFRTVCLREPAPADRSAIDTAASGFKSTGNMKQVFAEMAVHCSDHLNP